MTNISSFVTAVITGVGIDVGNGVRTYVGRTERVGTYR
jgi:hypothetical protein